MHRRNHYPYTMLSNMLDAWEAGQEAILKDLEASYTSLCDMSKQDEKIAIPILDEQQLTRLRRDTCDARWVCERIRPLTS